MCVSETLLSWSRSAEMERLRNPIWVSCRHVNCLLSETRQTAVETRGQCAPKTHKIKINVSHCCYWVKVVDPTTQSRSFQRRSSQPITWFSTATRKPRKGAAVIAASMHGFASCRKFKSPVTLTLTFDRVKVKSAYTVHVGLPAGPTTWL